jgi:hypothetical protein|tara:strand:+ start:501 stop:752 length:252 start_codon:yes stop_codon:yes gene_type:complete
MTAVDMWIKNKMNEALDSAGKILCVKVGRLGFADRRKILSTRLTFGGGIELVLDRPLSDRCSRLFTIAGGAENLHDFVIVEDI